MWYWNPVDCNEALPGVHSLSGCLKMDDDAHPFKTDATPDEKIWGSDKKGYPVLMDIPEPSHEDYVEMAESEKAALITAATNNISLWQTKLQLGVITDEEKVSLLAWLKYIDDVKAVDVGTAPDISWPEPPEN